jgi:hypothetical protein
MYKRKALILEAYSKVSNGRSKNSLSPMKSFKLFIYREVLTCVDRFMAVLFTATGAPPACKVHMNFANESVFLMTHNVWN